MIINYKDFHGDCLQRLSKIFIIKIIIDIIMLPTKEDYYEDLADFS